MQVDCDRSAMCKALRDGFPRSVTHQSLAASPGHVGGAPAVASAQINFACPTSYTVVAIRSHGLTLQESQALTSLRQFYSWNPRRVGPTMPTQYQTLEQGNRTEPLHNPRTSRSKPKTAAYGMPVRPPSPAGSLPGWTNAPPALLRPGTTHDRATHTWHQQVRRGLEPDLIAQITLPPHKP